MTRYSLLTQLSSLYPNTEPFQLWKIFFLTNQPSQMPDKHFHGKTRSKVQLTYFLINVVFQTWHFIHKIINPQICRHFFPWTTPATLGKTTLRIRFKVLQFPFSWGKLPPARWTPKLGWSSWWSASSPFLLISSSSASSSQRNSYCTRCWPNLCETKKSGVFLFSL